eukprot:6181823-Pleurochrysis_carterae.AAC.2
MDSSSADNYGYPLPTQPLGRPLDGNEHQNAARHHHDDCRRHAGDYRDFCRSITSRTGIFLASSAAPASLPTAVRATSHAACAASGSATPIAASRIPASNTCAAGARDAGQREGALISGSLFLCMAALAGASILQCILQGGE